MENLILHPKLEKLLLTKEFKSLNADEKEFVLSIISDSEYHNFRKILSTTTKIKTDNTITGRDEDKEKLLKSFDRTYKSPKKNILRKIAEYSMPVYKIAAGMIVLLSISYFINMKFFPASHDRIVFLTDTIYKEILVPESIWLADSSTREQYFHVNIKKSLHEQNDYDNLKSFESDLKESDYQDYSESAIMARHVGLVSDRDLINFRKKQNKGKNLHEDSMLRQFLVVVP